MKIAPAIPPKCTYRINKIDRSLYVKLLYKYYITFIERRLLYRRVDDCDIAQLFRLCNASM